MFKFAANLSFMFMNMPFLDRIAATAKAGLQGIEFPYQADVEPEAILKAAVDNNVGIALMNAPAGDWGKGERGIAVAPESREQEFLESVDISIRCAKLFELPHIHIMAGYSPKEDDYETLEKRYIRRMQYAADAFAKHDILLLMEPINTLDMPGFFLGGMNQALDIKAKIGRDNVRLQYDVYHAQRIQGELVKFMRDHFAEINHIQVADNPGRHQPGTGEINYPFIFNELRTLGYTGWIGLEYVPTPTSEESLGWIKEMGLDK